MKAGVSKSGSPAPKPTTSIPAFFMALALANGAAGVRVFGQEIGDEVTLEDLAVEPDAVFAAHGEDADVAEIAFECLVFLAGALHVPGFLELGRSLKFGGLGHQANVFVYVADLDLDPEVFVFIF